VTLVQFDLAFGSDSFAGKKAEWDAKIIEQEPDRRITWESKHLGAELRLRGFRIRS
jgi:uncharacterized membrane protein